MHNRAEKESLGKSMKILEKTEEPINLVIVTIAHTHSFESTNTNATIGHITQLHSYNAIGLVVVILVLFFIFLRLCDVFE